MSTASLAQNNRSTENFGFSGEFSNNSFGPTTNLTVNYNRSFYVVIDKICHAYYNFNTTTNGLLGTTITVKFPIPAAIPLSNINDVFFIAETIQPSGNIIGGQCSILVPGTFTVVFNTPAIVATNNILIELVYRIDRFIA